MIDYLFSNHENEELLIQQHIQDEHLESTGIYENFVRVESTKGVIYVNKNSKINNATIQIDDGIIIRI